MAQKFYAVVGFEDGLQVVPSNWLDVSVMKAVWPHFLSDSRYYKAVKFMEEPESSWKEYTVLKVYGTYNNYEIARKKIERSRDSIRP